VSRDIEIEAQQSAGRDTKAKGKKAQEAHEALVEAELERRMDDYLAPDSMGEDERENGTNAMDLSSMQSQVRLPAHSNGDIDFLDRMTSSLASTSTSPYAIYAKTLLLSPSYEL
jgi:hypothetical protein